MKEGDGRGMKGDDERRDKGINVRLCLNTGSEGGERVGLCLYIVSSSLKLSTMPQGSFPILFYHFTCCLSGEEYWIIDPNLVLEHYKLLTPFPRL